MGDKVWGRIIDPLWDHALVWWQSRWPRTPSGVALSMVLLVLGAVSAEQAHSFLELSAGLRGAVLGFGAIIGAVVGAIVWRRSWISYRVPDGHVGIVIALAIESDEEEVRVRSEFIDSLRDLLRQSTPVHPFSLKVVPRRIAHAILEDPTKLSAEHLQSRRAHIMIMGRIRSVSLPGGAEARDIRIEGHVIHAPVTAEVSNALATDMVHVLPRQLQIPKIGSLYAFETTSRWIELSARFVLAGAAFLSCDFAYAESLLLDLENRLPRLPKGMQSAPGVREIGFRLPERIKTLYLTWLNLLARAYFVTRETGYLELQERIADQILRRAPQTYTALLAKAQCEFLLRRNVKNARALVARCRQQPDAAWRYSKAFLLAYEGKLAQARLEYDRAFRVRKCEVTIPIQCEEFIQIVLNEEPLATNLHFCSGLINFYAKRDMHGAIRDFTAFLSGELEESPQRREARELLAEAQLRIAGDDYPDVHDRAG